MAESQAVTDEQVLSDLSGVTFSYSYDGTFYESLGDDALVEVGGVSQGPADDSGAVQVICDATYENEAYRSVWRVGLAYTGSGDGWALSGVTGARAVSVRATAPIQLDPVGRFDPSQAEVEFDEDAQTCRVTGAYRPLWFETVSGDPALLYRFDGRAWSFEGLDPSSAAVTYEGLVGEYDDPGNPGFEARQGERGYRLAIESVDGQGAVTGTLTLQGASSGGGQAWQQSAALAGQAVGSVDALGRGRVTLALTGELDQDGTPVALSACGGADVAPSDDAYGGRALKTSYLAVFDPRDGSGLAEEELSAVLEQIQAAAIPRE